MIYGDHWDCKVSFYVNYFTNNPNLSGNLQTANNTLEDQVMQAQDDILNAAAKAASAVAQVFLDTHH